MDTNTTAKTAGFSLFVIGTKKVEAATSETTSRTNCRTNYTRHYKRKNKCNAIRTSISSTNINSWNSILCTEQEKPLSVKNAR